MMPNEPNTNADLTPIFDNKQLAPQSNPNPSQIAPKSGQKSTTSKRLVLPGMITILTLLVIICLITTLYLWRQYSFLRTQSEINSFNYVATLIDISVGRVTQNKPVVDPMTNSEYLPGDRLVLPPLPSSLGPITEYSCNAFNACTQPGGLRINIASVISIDQADSPLQNTKTTDINSRFKNIPVLQACLRGVTLTFQPLDSLKFGNDPVVSNGSKKLKDSRTIYFYTEKACVNQALLKYVKLINSY